jgi:MFS family permease
VPEDPGPRTDPTTGKTASAASLAAAEAAYQEQVREDLPRNFGAHLAHGLLGQTGFRLVNAPTFLPAYVHLLSGSDFVVGLVRAVQYLGMFLSPLLGASLIEHRRRVLPVGYGVGIAMRLQILGVALAGAFLAPRWSVVAIAIFLFFFGFFMGMQGVIFHYVMSKVIPVERRGFLVGLRTALAGLTAAVVAYLGGKYFIDTNFLGNGYPVTFGVAFLLTCVGLSMLLFVREPEPPVVRPQVPLAERLKDLPELLRSDRAYTYYFLCRAIATMGRMAAPFYILYVTEAIGEPDGSGSPVLAGATIGVLSTAFILANSLTNFAWGLMADRTGFRKVFVATLVLWIVATVGLMLSQELPGFLLAFVGIGAGMGGFQMAAQNMVLEFGAREDLPVRIAVANSAQEFVGFIGPLVGGILAFLFSKETVFASAIAFQLLAIALVLHRVDEPRHRA